MSKTSLIVLALFLFSCGGESKKKKPVSSPRIKKEVKVVQPKQNERVALGDIIPFKFESGSTNIDSILVEENGNSQLFLNPSFDLTLSASRAGAQRIKSTVYFNGKKETHYSKIIAIPTNPPEEFTYEIVNTYPHSTEDYIQGLLVDDGFLFESTGQTGSSTLEQKNITTGETLEQINLEDQYFGEGLALYDDKFYQLTYHSKKCFVYNRQFDLIKTFTYEDEQGWGLTTYQGNLLMTNSTEKIIFRDPETFAVIDQLEAYDNTGKVEAINELEIIDGLLYANVYQEDYIVAIDPATGVVLRKIDMTGLLTDEETKNVDVLNGIAYDEKNDRIFVTGKLWPKLFEVKFLPKNQPL